MPDRLTDERLWEMLKEDEQGGCIDSHTPHEVFLMASELLELRKGEIRDIGPCLVCGANHVFVRGSEVIGHAK